MIANSKNNDIVEITSLLEPVWRKYPVIVFAYLFGSLASGHGWKTSDVDIAVYLETRDAFSFSGKLEFHGDCCRVLRRNDVDVIILNQTRNLLLLDEITRTGKVILNRDQGILDDFTLKIQHSAMDFILHRKRMMGV